MEDCKGMHTDFYNKNVSFQDFTLNDINAAEIANHKTLNNPLEVKVKTLRTQLASGCKE